MSNRKFIKKPIIVDAFQFRKDTVPDWFMDKVSTNEVVTFEDHCFIRTLEGSMRADSGDFIIKGIQGEIYPCKELIFIASYNEVKE